MDMQGFLDTKTDFQGVAANKNVRPVIKAMHRASILGAYGIGSKLNDWRDYDLINEDEFFGIRAFNKVGRCQRYVFVFRDVQDNNGYKFLAGTYGMQSILQTNKLKYALQRFKAPSPKLELVHRTFK